MDASPVFRSLLKPKLIFGLPYEMGLGILLLTLYSVMIVGFWVTPAILLGVLALRMTIELDPFALRLYKRYAHEGDVYLPHVLPGNWRSTRSASTGRGIPC